MKDLLKKATIIDVRTPEEFSGIHYPGAKNIPLDKIADRIEEIKEMRKPIVLYCRSGNRSGLATSLLKQYGVSEVYNGGGLDDIIKTSI